MNKNTRIVIIRVAIGLIVLALLIYGFWPAAVPVQTAVVERGPLQVIVEEEGETRLTEQYTVTAPTTAYIRRIGLKAGDIIEQGQPLVQLDPPRPAILDTRSRAGAVARVEAAEAALEQAETAAERAVAERDRMERLAAAGSATSQALEQARSDASSAISARNTARAELSAARATLSDEQGQAASASGSETLRSPVSGRVLAVHRQSEGPVNAGDPLIEIGDTGDLEIRVEVRSQDAVRIQPGTRVILDQWGGDAELEGIVSRVEPQGFTVVSALGVEEKRVQVISHFTSQPEERGSLGPGFRVLARFVIWEDDDVLQVPTSALFRTAGGWAVFIAENGTARYRDVSIGRQAGLRAQVLDGLSAGDVVIIHPGNNMEDGLRIDTENN